MNCEFDGKAILDAMLKSSITDNELKKILNVFEKHGIGATDAFAILIELIAAANNEEQKKEEENNA